MSPGLQVRGMRSPGKRGCLSRALRSLCCLGAHCRTSDPVWEAYSEARRSPALQWMLWPVLRAAQAASILPPPPGRLRSLQALLALLLMSLATLVALQVFLMHTLEVIEHGFQMALHAYLVENLLKVLQAPIILAVAWCNLGRFAPTLAAVLARTGPLRAAPAFIAGTAFICTAQATSQVLIHLSAFREQHACYSLASAWAVSSAVVLDRLVLLVLTLAALKIQVVNRRLSSLRTKQPPPPKPLFVSVLASSSTASWLPPEPPLDPAVQRGLLQTVASRWEDTMEQVSALLGHDMLGLPLLFSLLHISIGMVTSTALAVQEGTAPAIRVVTLIDLVIYLARVSSLATTAGWLYREAKETESIIGALDTSRWPIRERQRVSHLLHLSREATRLRVCGIVSIGHSLLFTVMGNTVTYVVMLLQYPILTPGKAAAVLNKTETIKAAASSTP